MLPNVRCLCITQEADVVICDQNLEYGTRQYYGTDLIRRLHADRFPGLLCIHSANDADEDIAAYRKSGAHLCLGKGTSPKEMKAEIERAYGRLLRERPPPEVRDPDPSTAKESTAREGPKLLPVLPGSVVGASRIWSAPDSYRRSVPVSRHTSFLSVDSLESA